MNGITRVIFSGIAGLFVIFALRTAHIWEEQRRPPLPPQASPIGELILPGNPVAGSAEFRQITYRVPLPVHEVHLFYQQELARRGWFYCETQTTPGCARKPLGAAAVAQIEVYQRLDDHGMPTATIEIQATWNAE